MRRLQASHRLWQARSLSLDPNPGIVRTALSAWPEIARRGRVTWPCRPAAGQRQAAPCNHPASTMQDKAYRAIDPFSDSKPGAKRLVITDPVAAGTACC